MMINLMRWYHREPTLEDILSDSIVRDVMEAGGWKNEETLLRSYQQPDAETVKRVVLHPTQRIVSC